MTIAAYKQARDSIDQEIAARKQIHQGKIARLKIGQSNLMALAAPSTTTPLVILAHGDSWFDYPLTGNGLPITNTDIVAQIETMGSVNPVILNVSHYGDATTDEMSLPKQQRMIESLQDPSNWLDAGKPDAILFSGGGNDIAGDKFCIFLDYATTPGSTGLDAARTQGVLDMIEASYKDLFSFRDQYAQGVPIYGHCYDFPIPNGNHPLCAGPWLKPSLDFAGWTDLAKGTDIAHQALADFKNLLQGLAGDPNNNFVLVDTQGTLGAAEWANELHPIPSGFQKIAAKFITALQGKFPGRI